MTPKQLRNAAVARYGEIAWADKLAKECKVNRSTVFRWANGTSRIPGSVEIVLKGIGDGQKEDSEVS